MNISDDFFPKLPTKKGHWQTIYLEPIVGSGEQIAIAATASLENSEYRAIQAIRTELLDSLYGVKAANMQDFIDWVIDSANKELRVNNGSLINWKPPFSGIKIGELHFAADETIEGILKQALRFTASLSSLALDADRDEDEEQPRKYSEQWATNISEELKSINPKLTANFKKKIKISDSDVLTQYGFVTENYVSNFGLLIPVRLSSSLNTVKAKLFDLETLKKSGLLIKPSKYEIIMGTPSSDDPTLTNKAIKNLDETIKMVSEFANSENIDVFRAENARMAAIHLNQVAA